jgi:putative FmdB family regulatory protein
MPLFDYECSGCGSVREVLVRDGHEPDHACQNCSTGQMQRLPYSAGRRGKSSVFPFDNPHISADGTPVTITDIGHLRRLERQFGVVLSAFSNEPHNLDPIRDLPRYRGWDKERS